MKTIKAIGIMAAAIVVLNGCSGYRLASRTKNVIVDQISSDVFMVNFCGNAYMTQAEAERYALQRASEAVLSKGYSHFIVLEKRDNSELCELKPRNEYDAASPLKTDKSSSGETLQFAKPNITLKVQGFFKDASMPEKAIDAGKFLEDNFPGLKE